MVATLWGMSMYAHEDTIYRILEYVQVKNDEWVRNAQKSRPVQDPWSNWAVYEIIGELKMDEQSYSCEVIDRFINLMKKYEEVAEPERKTLFRTARATAEELYLYLFGPHDDNRKENVPF